MLLTHITALDLNFRETNTGLRYLHIAVSRTFAHISEKGEVDNESATNGCYSGEQKKSGTSDDEVSNG